MRYSLIVGYMHIRRKLFGIQTLPEHILQVVQQIPLIPPSHDRMHQQPTPP
jgi:hypothetical protein